MEASKLSLESTPGEMYFLWDHGLAKAGEEYWQTKMKIIGNVKHDIGNYNVAKVVPCGNTALGD